MQTHIEDDEKHKVYNVEQDENPKQPPVCIRREKQRKASTGMVKQESKLFPKARASGGELGGNPYHEAQHDREAGVSNDDEKPHGHQNPFGGSKRVHAVRGQGKSHVIEGHVGGPERPPGLADSILRKDVSVMLVGKDVWEQTDDGQEGEDEEVEQEHNGQSSKRPILNAAEFLTLFEGQAKKV